MIGGKKIRRIDFHQRNPACNWIDWLSPAQKGQAGIIQDGRGLCKAQKHKGEFEAGIERQFTAARVLFFQGSGQRHEGGGCTKALVGHLVYQQDQRIDLV